MTARLLAFVIWAAVAGTLVFWGLRLFVSSPSAPAHAVAAAVPTAPRGDLTRLFGPDAAPVVETAPVAQVSSRFRLLGVVAPRAGSGSAVGVALLAVDDKPPRAFRVGSSVDGAWIVQTVHRRGVSLGPTGGAPALQLELPPPAPAATGTLPLVPSNSPVRPIVAAPPVVPVAPAETAPPPPPATSD